MSGFRSSCRISKWFWCPTLIAVHPKMTLREKAGQKQKPIAWELAVSKAGVLKSSFVAEVKSDLMGEQTILWTFTNGFYSFIR